MIDVTTKEARKWILHLNPDWNPSPMIVALFSHCDTLEHRVERMQAVVDAATNIVPALHGVRDNLAMMDKYGPANIDFWTWQRRAVERLTNVENALSKLDAAREGKR